MAVYAGYGGGIAPSKAHMPAAFKSELPETGVHAS
jgi:hypothetical protein